MPDTEQLIQHVSFSALKNYNFCPQYMKYINVDKVKGFLGNAFTAFGTAIHEVSERGLLDPTLNKEECFEKAFLRELQTLPEEARLELDRQLVQDMRVQGRHLSPLILPALKEKFGDYEIVSTEEQIMEPILDVKEGEYKFKGFIDLIIKTGDTYHIIDWKSCGWGWDMQRKTDAMTTYQLTYYKHFFAQKHGIDPKNIETYFGLLKRTAKKKNVEIFRVTSGVRKTKNSLNLMHNALYNIHRGRFIKNKIKCRACELHRTVCK